MKRSDLPARTKYSWSVKTFAFAASLSRVRNAGNRVRSGVVQRRLATSDGILGATVESVKGKGCAGDSRSVATRTPRPLGCPDASLFIARPLGRFAPSLVPGARY